MYDIVCIGHITKDCIVTPQLTAYQAGGTAWYISKGIAALNQEREISYALLTAMAETDLAPVEELRAQGMEVFCLPSKETLFFENKYGENFNSRTQRVLSQAGPFTLKQICQIEARYTILGSLLAHDFPIEAFAYLHERSCLVVDVQGYLREVRGEHVFATDWSEKLSALRYVDVLKVNEYEMEVLTGENDPHKAALQLAAWGVGEVLLTFGSYGSLIYDSHTKQFFDIPAYPPKQLVDATGCGDTYVMGYVFKRAQGADIEEAGRFAALVSSKKLENVGPLSTGDYPRL